MTVTSKQPRADAPMTPTCVQVVLVYSTTYPSCTCVQYNLSQLQETLPFGNRSAEAQALPAVHQLQRCQRPVFVEARAVYGRIGYVHRQAPSDDKVWLETRHRLRAWRLIPLQYHLVRDLKISVRRTDTGTANQTLSLDRLRAHCIHPPETDGIQSIENDVMGDSRLIHQSDDPAFHGITRKIMTD
jgi:hypothetical protein